MGCDVLSTLLIRECYKIYVCILVYGAIECNSTNIYKVYLLNDHGITKFESKSYFFFIIIGMTFP